MIESQIAENIGRELVGFVIPVAVGLYFGFKALKKKKEKNQKLKLFKVILLV